MLVDFNYWARDRMLDAVAAADAEQYTRDLGNSFRRSATRSCTSVFGRVGVALRAGRASRRRRRFTSRDYPDLDDAARRLARRSKRGSAQHVADRRRRAHRRASSTTGCMNGQPGRSRVLADAAARRQSRHVSSRPGDDDAPAARRGAAEEHGSDHVSIGSTASWIMDLPRRRRGPRRHRRAARRRRRRARAGTASATRPGCRRRTSTRGSCR